MDSYDINKMDTTCYDHEEEQQQIHNKPVKFRHWRVVGLLHNVTAL